MLSNQLATDSSMHDIDYIKVPHRGSVDGLTENLLKVIMPIIAVIGLCGNSWDFLWTEIIDMLGKYKV